MAHFEIHSFVATATGLLDLISFCAGLKHGLAVHLPRSELDQAVAPGVIRSK